MQGIHKLGTVMHHLVEVSPFVWKGDLCIFESVRPRTPDNTRGGTHYLRIRRLADGTRDVRDDAEFAACPVLSEFGEGFTFGVPFVHDDELFVYATLAGKPAVDDIHVFRTRDLARWEQSVAIRGENEQLFNMSVCRAEDVPGGRFVMAYETNDRRWPAFTTRFAESRDLVAWTPIPPERALHATDRYTACPTLRWLDGYFYIVCLEMPRRSRTLDERHGTPGWWFEEMGARSRDLAAWEMAPANPIIAPEPDGSEDINTSDIDFCEFGGRTIIYYAWGNQIGEERLSHAVWDGPERSFLRSWFPGE